MSVPFNRFNGTGGQGDRTSFITVTTSASLLAGGSPSELVDGAYETTTLSFNGGVTNGWIKFDFGSGQAVVIDAFAFWMTNAVPGSPLGLGVWQWQGSTDDVTFTPLGNPFTLTGIDPPSLPIMANVMQEPAGNTTGYRYYRLTQLSGATPPSQPFIREIEFAITGYNGEIDPGTVDPDTGNTGGTGDRTALVWVSQNFHDQQPGGSVANIVDGSNADAFRFETGTSGAEIIFDFGPTGSLQYIDAFTLRQNDAGSHGTWSWEGTNDPQGEGWTEITGSIALGGTAGDNTYAVSTPSAFRMFRLRQTSGMADDWTWLQEIEFSLVAGGPVGAGLPDWVTGDRTADITVTTNAILSDGDITDLVNGSASTVQFQAGQSGLYIDFEFSEPTAINAARWDTSNTNVNASWRWLGSDDGTNWISLSKPSYLVGADGGREAGVFGANITGFKFYRMEQTGGVTVDTVRYREVDFRQIETKPFVGGGCFSYENDGGMGDRVGLITVTGSTGVTGSSPNGLDSCIDGARTGGAQVAFDLTTNPNAWLKFDFGTPRRITQMLFWAGSASTPTGFLCQIAGSDDDTTWTDIGAPFYIDDRHINGQFYWVGTSIAVNDKAFRYYRLQRVGGSSTSFVLIQVDFYINGPNYGVPFTWDTYALSRGDRRGLISLANSVITPQAGQLTNLLDGNETYDTTYGVRFLNGQPSSVIQFDFPEPVYIDRVSWIYSGGNHGTFTWRGSNDGFVTEDVELQAGWSMSTLIGVTPNFAHADYFKSYRMVHETGNWVGDILWVQAEVIFWIAPNFSAACDGGPFYLEVEFTDEGEFRVESSDEPVGAGMEFGFDMECTLSVDSGNSVNFQDEGEFDVEIAIQQPPVELEIHFVDESEFYVHEASEPVVVVQSLILASGR